MSANLHHMTGVDRLLHEPSRLMIVTILVTAAQADFIFLLNETGLTRGNLSAHLSRLEKAGYIKIEKTFRGKVPQTLCSLTDAGRTAFTIYRKQLREIVDSISSDLPPTSNEV